MREIDFTFETKDGGEMTVKVEYTIIPFRDNNTGQFPDDDIEVFSVINEGGQEIELEEETLTDLIEYIRENDEDDIDTEYYL